MSVNALSRLELRPYQEATVVAAIKPKAKVWRRLLVLATGAGKTVIAAEILNRALKPGRRALFLAHRDELLSQAKSEIEGYVPGIHVELEQAESRATRSVIDEGRRHVVVGSVLTMQGNRLKTWARDTFDLVIIDEAHHATSKSYQNIVDHFGCMSAKDRTPLVGVTATPARTDKVGLGVLFQEISASHNIRDLIEAGYLCDIRALSVRTETDLRGVKVTAGDFNARELEDATNNANRNSLILAAYRKYAFDRPTIVFAAGVGHALHLAELFCASGVSSEAMYGAMDEASRRGALARYASGETRVLTNYALLGEGFNAPQTSCIILGRPSKSSLVITQAIGRGTRLNPGKEDCLVIDVRDVTGGKNLFTAASLAGLPANFDLKGKNLFNAFQEYAELKKVSPELASQSLTPEEVESNLKLALEQIRAREVDLLQREDLRKARVAARVAEKVPPPRLGETYQSPFMWYSASDEHFEVSPDAGETTYTVFCNESLRWVVSSRQRYKRLVLHGTEYPDLLAAIYAADRTIATEHENTALIERDAAWTREPATEKQLAALARFGAPDEADLTKGEAARRLNEFFARSRYEQRNALPVPV
jgi:superfamily II DNA or RNA helicase